MIARREQEIKEFVPKEYFGLTLKAAGIRWSWQDKKSGSYRTFDKERAEKLKKELEGKALTVTSVEKVSKKQNAPGLYDLTELQRDASLSLIHI